MGLLEDNLHHTGTAVRRLRAAARAGAARRASLPRWTRRTVVLPGPARHRGAARARRRLSRFDQRRREIGQSRRPPRARRGTRRRRYRSRDRASARPPGREALLVGDVHLGDDLSDPLEGCRPPHLGMLRRQFLERHGFRSREYRPARSKGQPRSDGRDIVTRVHTLAAMSRPACGASSRPRARPWERCDRVSTARSPWRPRVGWLDA